MISMAEKKYTLRIPEELHAQLEAIAKGEKRSLHNQILVMLEAAARAAAPAGQAAEAPAARPPARSRKRGE